MKTNETTKEPYKYDDLPATIRAWEERARSIGANPDATPGMLHDAIKFQLVAQRLREELQKAVEV